MTKILIADDNEQNLYLLKVLLEGNGYELTLVKNGIEALEAAKSNSPNLIISDILMPGMDGFSFCRECKTNDHLKEIPFVFYTATYTDPKDEEFALSLGAQRFIRKPAEPIEFIKIIRDVLDQQKKGKLVDIKTPVEDNGIYFKKYNEALIRKMENKMLDLEKANSRLSDLFNASIDLATIKPIDELIPKILGKVIRVMGCRYANYFEYHEAEKVFYLHAALGYSKKELAIIQGKLKFKLGEERGLVGLVGQTQEPLIVNDTLNDPYWIKVDESIRSAIFLPLVCEGSLIGVIAILSLEPGRFNIENSREILTMSNNLAVAIEKNRYVEKVKQSEFRYRTLVEGSIDAIISMDDDGVITDWNRGAVEIFGFTKGEQEGKTFDSLVPDHDKKQLVKVIKEVRKEGFKRAWETQLLAKKSRLIDVEMTISSLGPKMGFTLILRDTSVRKQLEHQLEEYSQKLEQMVEKRTQELHDAQKELIRKERLASLGQLSGSVAHELRNPLNVITSTIFYLKKTLSGLDDKSKEYLDIVENEAFNSAKIIKNLLDFGGETKTEKEEVLVNIIISQAVDRNKPPDNILLETTDIPKSLKINVDPRQIGQVLDNLVINAYQAMPNGGKLIINATKKAKLVQISVSDTGVGISQENMAHLFEPLFTTKIRGIGLGLALSKKYINANQGSIDVKSKINKGSTFIVAFNSGN